MTNGRGPMIDDDTRSRMQNWFIWKVVLPLGIMILLWPIYALILNSPHAYESAFAHGDLILFAVLILLEATVEGDGLRRQGGLFQLFLGLARVSAVLLILIFGFIKTDVIKNDVPLLREASGEVIGKMHFYSSFNVWVAIVAVIASLAAYWTAAHKKYDERLAELSEGAA